MSARRFVAGSAGLVILVACAAGAGAHQSGADFDDAEALEYSQAAIGQTVDDYAFRDSDGRPVTLAAFRGRPLVVSMIYTSCSYTCPVLTQTVAAAVRVAREALGAQSFAVVTVGFDSAVDTPARMRAYKLGQGIDLPDWAFLSADHATVDALSFDLGFIYFDSPKGFDHLSQTTVLDREGRVYTQLYGEDFEPPVLVEPLKQLVFGTEASLTSVSGLINRVRLFCTIYDPASGRYRFDYSLFVGIIVGALSLGAIAFVLVREWHRARRAKNSA